MGDMASHSNIIDLTESDDEDYQPVTLPRAPATIPATAEIIEISDDEDEVQAEDDNEDQEDEDEDPVNFLATIANAFSQAPGPPIEPPVPQSARIPLPASRRRSTPAGDGEVVLHLFSDGSFIHNRFGGAGVSWRDQNKIWHGGAVALGRVKSSTMAERHAVLEAIKAAHAIVDRRPEVTKVIVQTDCEDCLIALARARAAEGADSGVLEETLHQEALLKSRGLDVKVWWVKGHSDSVGNDIADNLARYGADQSKTSPASWGVTYFDPPSAKLDLANKLRHGERKPRTAITTPQVRHARKEAKRRARLGIFEVARQAEEL